jgi:hypothetical protein
MNDGDARILVVISALTALSINHAHHRETVSISLV